jgi:hypothetical protein
MIQLANKVYPNRTILIDIIFLLQDKLGKQSQPIDFH